MMKAIAANERRFLFWAARDSEERLESTHGPIRCVPWSRFAEELWADRLLH